MGIDSQEPCRCSLTLQRDIFARPDLRTATLFESALRGQASLRPNNTLRGPTSGRKLSFSRRFVARHLSGPKTYWLMINCCVIFRCSFSIRTHFVANLALTALSARVPVISEGTSENYALDGSPPHGHRELVVRRIGDPARRVGATLCNDAICTGAFVRTPPPHDERCSPSSICFDVAGGDEGAHRDLN